MGRGPGPTSNKLMFVPFGHNFRDDDGNLVRNAANPGFFTINTGAIQDDGGTTVPLNPPNAQGAQLTFFTPANNDFFNPLNNPPLNSVKATSNFTSFAIIVVDDVQFPTISRVQGGGSGSATSFTFTTDNIPVDNSAGNRPVDLVVGGTSYQGWIYTIPQSGTGADVTIVANNVDLPQQSVIIADGATGDARKLYVWVESGSTPGNPKPDVLMIGAKTLFEAAVAAGTPLEAITGTSINSNVYTTFTVSQSQETLNPGVESEAVPLEENPDAGVDEPAVDTTLIERFYTDNPAVRVFSSITQLILTKGESQTSLLTSGRTTIDDFSINLENTKFDDFRAFTGIRVTGDALSNGVPATSTMLVGLGDNANVMKTIKDKSGNEVYGIYSILITVTESSTLISTGIWTFFDDGAGQEVEEFYPTDFIKLNNSQAARINITASAPDDNTLYEYDITVSNPADVGL